MRIRPDLRFRHPRSGSVTYVGDIKYKLTADATARSADYYQLLAYTTALNLPEGVLIYCQADGGEPAGEVTVRHAGKKLHVRALDLSGSLQPKSAPGSSDWPSGSLEDRNRSGHKALSRWQTPQYPLRGNSPASRRRCRPPRLGVSPGPL